MSFILIPGNIKQQFLPFVLNPSSPLHKSYGSSTDMKDKVISPLYFTYRQKNADDFKNGGFANLRFYPSSMDSLHVNDDLSFKLLYNIDNTKFTGTNESLTIQSILDHLPGVQIREFLPDTRLDQCINMFVDFFSNMAKMFTSDEEKGKAAKTNESADKKSEDGLFKKIKMAAWYTMKYFVGGTKPNLYNDLGTISDLPFSSYKPEVYSPGSENTSPGYYVMTFPYTLYYRLQSCVTTNIYEIPAVDSERRVIAANGMKGWTDGGSDFMSSGGFRISNILGKIPLIGDIANMILGNIGINYMPWWNAEAGAKTTEPAVSLKFDLFNDSAEAAMANFIFVNTIVPNNRWILYNMFLHSSCLYDVKIEGLNRLYACAGDFNVTYEGVLRDPPNKFVTELVSMHKNPNMSDAFLDNILKNKLIKIPDVYRVSLNFLSLLPANFNNFIFNYALNTSHIVGPHANTVYDLSAMAEALPKAVSAYGLRIKAFWNTDGDENARTKAANEVKPEFPPPPDSEPTKD